MVQVIGMGRTLTRSSQREAVSLKRVLSRTLKTEIKRRKTTKSELARALGTSRPGVDRVLDENNTSITLRGFVRAAATMGYKIHMTLEPRIDRVERVRAPVTAEPLMNQLGDALDRLPAR